MSKKKLILYNVLNKNIQSIDACFNHAAVQLTVHFFPQISHTMFLSYLMPRCILRTWFCNLVRLVKLDLHWKVNYRQYVVRLRRLIVARRWSSSNRYYSPCYSSIYSLDYAPYYSSIYSIKYLLFYTSIYSP